MFDTIENITKDVITELGLATGAGVQAYTEPQIESGIVRAFDHLFKKRFWDHLTFTTEHGIDQDAGYPTSDLLAVQTVEDIEWVRIPPYQPEDRLRFLNKEFWQEGNAPGYSLIPWGEPLQQARLIRVYPFTIAETIAVRARRWPTINTPTSIVPFDKLALTHFVTANILANDGMNPSAQSRHDVLFTQRYQDLISSETREISYYGRSTDRSFTVAET